MVKSLDIVLFMYERLGLLITTVDSLRAASDFPMRIIVADNGSSPKTVAALNQLQEEGLFDELVLLGGKADLWAARRRACQSVATPVFGLADADWIFPAMKPCFIRRLLSFLEEYPCLMGVATERSANGAPDRGKARRILYYRKDLRLIATLIEGNFGLFRAGAIKNLRNPGETAVAEDIIATHLSCHMWKDPANHAYMEGSKNLRACGWNRAGYYSQQLAQYQKVVGSKRHA